MQINNFTHRYVIHINGKDTNQIFTSREEAREQKRKLTSTPRYSNNNIRIVQQTAQWGNSIVVS